MMKKIIIIFVSILCITSTLNAQNNETNSHSDLFPKEGHFSIGIDMSNLIKFVGNSFSSNGTSSPNYNMIESSQMAVGVSPTVFGKYFLNDNSVIRARLGLTINNMIRRHFIFDDGANASNPLNNQWSYEQTVDKHKIKQTQFEFGIGLEKRKSFWKVQGYAGAEFFISYIYNKEESTYGNKMSMLNQQPTSSNFNGNISNPIDRTLSISGGNNFLYGTSLLTGADYFLSKNFSIGAELNLFIYGSHTNEQVRTNEVWTMNNIYTTDRPIAPTGSGFHVQPGGFFNLNVYF